MADNCKQKIWSILQEYGQTSTVAGLHYAFEPKQSRLANVIWILLILTLTSLGVYVSIKSYIQWQEEPVVTTVTTTGLPISEVPFPSVVICAQGDDIDSEKAAIFKIMFEELNKTAGNVSYMRIVRLLENPQPKVNFTKDSNSGSNFYMTPAL